MQARSPEKSGVREALVLCLFAVSCLTHAAFADPAGVEFSKPQSSIEAYDFVEVTATVDHPDVANPFTNTYLSGTFQTKDGSKTWNVDGFCDSNDGSTFRIRFMPPAPGDYSYTVNYNQGQYKKSSTGEFHATDAQRRGPIAIDSKYPWHFVWSGTGEHYFFNGTTAYWLVGWRDDHVIQYSVDRLHRLKVNRIRVTIAGREAITFFGEPLMTGKNWTVFITAWPAQNPDDPTGC
jgi:Domain of unknown function (DUF5060)